MVERMGIARLIGRTERELCVLGQYAWNRPILEAALLGLQKRMSALGREMEDLEK